MVGRWIERATTAEDAAETAEAPPPKPQPPKPLPTTSKVTGPRDCCCGVGWPTACAAACCAKSMSWASCSGLKVGCCGMVPPLASDTCSSEARVSLEPSGALMLDEVERASAPRNLSVSATLIDTSYELSELCPDELLERRCDQSKRLARPGTNFPEFGDVNFVAKKGVLESRLEKTSGGPLKKGEFGRRNRSKTPGDRRGEPAATYQRGAEEPPSASSLRTPRADTTGSRALVLVCVASRREQTSPPSLPHTRQ